MRRRLCVLLAAVMVVTSISTNQVAYAAASEQTETIEVPVLEDLIEETEEVAVSSNTVEIISEPTAEEIISESATVQENAVLTYEDAKLLNTQENPVHPFSILLTEVSYNYNMNEDEAYYVTIKNDSNVLIDNMAMHGSWHYDKDPSYYGYSASMDDLGLPVGTYMLDFTFHNYLDEEFTLTQEVKVTDELCGDSIVPMEDDLYQAIEDSCYVDRNHDGKLTVNEMENARYFEIYSYGDEEYSEITDYSPLKYAINLENFELNVSSENPRTIANLDFMKDMPKLSYVYGKP